MKINRILPAILIFLPSLSCEINAEEQLHIEQHLETGDITFEGNDATAIQGHQVITINESQEAEGQIYQSLKADDIHISGKNGAVTGIQVITSDKSQGIDGDQVVVINSDNACSGTSISSKSDGEGKIKIYSNQTIAGILPFIKVKLQDGSLISLDEANLTYKVSDNMIKIESQDAQNLSGLFLNIKNSNQIENILNIPFYKRVKMRQNCW